MTEGPPRTAKTGMFDLEGRSHAAAGTRCLARLLGTVLFTDLSNPSSSSWDPTAPG